MKFAQLVLFVSILLNPLPGLVTVAQAAQLPGPPLSGSPEEHADLVQLLALQNTRTAEDCAKALADAETNLANFYGAPNGPLTSVEVKKWDQFITAQQLPVSAAATQAKNDWKRLRPYLTHSEVVPCLPLEKSFSYPSKHAALAEFEAKILIIAYPDRAEQLAARAKELAFDRVIGGVHYPSDIQGGRLLGDAIFDEKNQDGSFEKLIRAQL